MVAAATCKEHTADACGVGRMTIVERVADHDDVAAVDAVLEKRLEMPGELLGLAIACPLPVSVDSHHVVIEPEALDSRDQLVVPPHRQQRLGPTLPCNAFDGGSGGDVEIGIADPLPVRIVEHVIDGSPLVVFDGATQ